MDSPWTSRPDLVCVELKGEGGFGKVYEASSTRTHETFAIKVISVRDLIRRTADCDSDISAAAELAKEINALFILKKHKNIVEYIDHWMEGPLAIVYSDLLANPPLNNHHYFGNFSSTQDDSFLFIRMEYCETNLKDYIDRRLTFNRIETNEIILQIAKALCFIHSQDIIHRDLNPRNILLKSTEPVDAKVCDFGLSKLDQSDLGNTTLTNPVGYYWYRSPETLYRNRYYPKSDVYSLGLIYFEMLSHIRMEEAKRNAIFENFDQRNYDALEESNGFRFEMERSLLKKMLDGNVSRRCTAKQVVDRLSRIIFWNKYGKILLLLGSLALILILWATGGIIYSYIWIGITKPDIPPECGPYKVILYQTEGCMHSLIELNVSSRTHMDTGPQSLNAKSAWVSAAGFCTGKGVKLWPAYFYRAGQIITPGELPITAYQSVFIPCGICNDFHFFNLNPLKSVTCE